MKGFKQARLTMLALLLYNSVAFASITGKVQSVDGKPIANAKVICQLYEGKGKKQRFVTRTDWRGQFVFPEAKITPEGYGASLYAIAEGYGVGGCQIRSNNPKLQFSPEALPPDKPVTITLFPETVLEFRVVDENKEPVQGVKVTVELLVMPFSPVTEIFEMRMPSWLFVSPIASELGLTAVSDAEGFVRVPHLPIWSRVRVWIEHERFGRIPLRSVSEPFVNDIQLSGSPLTVLPNVVLEGHGEAEGEVRYEDGKPAKGIWLFWQPQEQDGRQGKVVTDEQGRYRISNLAPGIYFLSVHYELQDKLDWVAVPPVVTFSIRSGQKTSLPTITLQKGGFLEGFAKDAETGEPISGITILVGQIFKRADDIYALHWVAQTRTDQKGHYRVQVPPGEFQCHINAPSGYLSPIRLSPFAPNPYSGVIKVGETTRMDIHLRKGLSVTGKVVDERNQPVAGAVVLNMEGEFGVQRTVTDEQGNFFFSNLNPLKQIRLRAYKGDLRTKEDVMIFTDDPKAKNITLRIAKISLTKVKGRIVDEEGKPIPYATVQLWSNPAILTNSQGYFELVGLWHGQTYYLKITADGYSEIKTKPFMLKVGETLDLGTLVLKRAGIALTGFVMGEEGVPIQNAGVYTVRTQHVAALTDRNGRFVLRGLTAGRHKLVIREPTRYGWLNLEVEVGEGKDALRILSVDPIRANVGRVEVHNGELLIFLRPVMPKAGTETKQPQAELELRPPEVGKPAPDLSVQVWFNTKPLTLSALKGKIVVLDFCDWFG